MQEYFHALADAITASLHGDEFYTATFHAEDSDFVRFNRSAIRQAGTVVQRYLSLDLIHGRRHAAAEIALCGDFESDRAHLNQVITELREQLPYLPEDPHLLYATTVHSSVHQGENRLPVKADAVAAMLDAGTGRDLVGLYAAGGIYAGFANALGQRNWFASYTFNCDWSFYYQRDKAVKTSYAGFVWEPTMLTRRVAEAAEQLDILGRPPRTIPPGRYRVYLAPAALNDILEMLAWSGFGLKDHRTKQTTLLKMVEEGVRLHPSITIRENTRDGVAPNFQEAGFIKPDQVTLIASGAFYDCLVSPRSAKEYDVPTNGASAAEAPESVEMAAGEVARDDVLRQLDTGVYINNLWYLNYSDRSACRMTGMTRFATFWVEGGMIQAPLSVMRFDESIYRMFGDHLVGLTADCDFILDSGTYHRRSTGSSRLPGALVEDFTFTL
ncbi:MAG TPA: metallopeptidase TldD-related protein [Candidatus Tectomicrobia bacterium]|nr:metallopeptidase TldD-related protein [Candidatus Tectomicrobia bacterium]